MDRPGFEPGTSRVQAERSSRLSYRPTYTMCGFAYCFRFKKVLAVHTFGVFRLPFLSTVYSLMTSSHYRIVILELGLGVLHVDFQEVNVVCS